MGENAMTHEGFKRKLTAILSADVVGYSQLMENNEDATIQTLNTYRNSMSTLVQQHRGRVVDMTGDNLMAEFSSVVDAVKCAVETQKEMSKRNAELPENRQMLFRIGVNLGDIVEEEDRIYGDGVNIAARLEGLAEAGGICISRTAYDQVKKKLELGYEYLGEHSVKNISEPVHVYRVLMEPEAAGKVIGEKRKEKRRMTVAAVIVLLIGVAGLGGWYLYFEQSKRIEPASIEKMAFPLPEKPSIAVLPFDNMSGDSKQDYFSDGLTEQIISALSRAPYLFVIARNSTFTYKRKPVKVQQVAEELGVRYVLEGSVRKSEDRVRITAQLVDALKGYHIWSESYDRDLTDIFALQDEITLNVVKAMRLKLTAGDQARVHRKGTKNLKAYLKSLEAVEPFFLFKKEANARAKQLLEEAIALDPEYSWAYSFLGFCHYWDVVFGWSESPPKSIEKAFELAQKAMSLDDSLAEPYELISKIYVFQRKHEQAIAKAQQAIKLNPNGAFIVYNLGWVLRCTGRPEEAIPWIKKSMRLNPTVFSQAWVFDSLGRTYFLAEKYEEAIAKYRMAVKLNPDYRDAHIGLAATYAVLGREEEARTEVSEILRIDPNFSIKKYARFMYFQVGLEPEIEGLRKAGLPE
jgi:adenylate cyclase